MKLTSLTGKTVLVTGAAGSIGSQVVRQLQAHDCRHVFAFDSCEYTLFKLEREKLQRTECILGDITWLDDLNRVFMREKIDVVFHAAAYKHVGMCEANREAAHRVNCYGTILLLEAASDHEAKVVLVSTDKAVRPTTWMGETKRKAERLVRGYPDNVVARLGNVWGSSGSVIELWKEIRERNRNLLPMDHHELIPLTDPEATRYFINHTDAARFIIQTASLPGGVYVPDMGEPRHLLDIAQHFGQHIDIIGLQPGEKLHEELLVSEAEPTTIAGIWRDRDDAQAL